MKKFFTLIAAALLSSGAFAQTEWQKITTNTDMEGEQAEDWSSFWCHDWRQGVEITEGSGQQYDGQGQFQGFAEIVVDPTDPNNHCARVIIRTEAEADEAGNKVKPDGSESLASWDCQFFIYANEQIPSGKELRMTLRVRAEKAGMFETQAHQEPGNYNHYQLFGNINYTTDWQRIQVTQTIDTNHTQEANGKWMQSVAFNLSTMTDGNVIYFDDVKLEIRDPKGPSDITGWFEMLRHGTLSNDQIQNYTNFTGRDAADGVDKPARIVNDAIDGQPALTVSSACWEGTRQEQQFDEEGNPVLDEEGNPTYKDVQYWHKADGTEKTTIDDWEAQFFVTVPHKFIPNSKYRLVMWYRADEPADVDTQLHNMPGAYVHYEAIGTLNFTQEWQKLELIEADMRSESKGCQTIAFNCNKLKDKPNNYYFRFDEFSFNDADVTFDERVLKQEDMMLPVPEAAQGDEGITVNVDMTPCVNTLEVEDFVNLIDDNHTILLQDIDEEGDVYSILSSASTGLLLNDKGLYDENGKIIIEVNPESDPDKTEFSIFNEGYDFQGKTANTKLGFTFGGWYYLYNLTLANSERYQEWLGVSAATATQPANAAIYDLTGRRVDKAVKGLYIQNGKKYFVR